MKVSKDASGLKAMMYSIDQPGPGVPAGAVTLQGTAIKITVPAIGGVFEGKLANTDGTAMTGTWTQGGPNPTPLEMVLATAQTRVGNSGTSASADADG